MTIKELADIERQYKDIDWERFLSRSDLHWSNLQFTGTTFWNDPRLPDTDWGNSAFIGNGMVGAAIYKGSKQSLKWELGRNDVEAHNFIEGVDWCIPRVQIGDVFLHPVGSIQSENMHLSLWNGEAFGRIKTDKGSISWRSFVHAEENVILIEVKTAGEESKCSLEFQAKHGISSRLNFAASHRIPEHYPIPPKPFREKVNNVEVSIQTFVKDNGESEGECGVAWKEKVADRDHRIFYISIENSHNDNSARINAAKAVQSFLEKSIEKVVDSHRNWWHQYYPQSFLSFSDPWWEKFYWLQIYKLASASRGDDNIVIDNQGPWLPRSAWPGSWWNLNVQLSYSPLYKANRLNIAESLIKSLETHKEQLRKNAEPLGIQDGIYMGRTSGRNLWSPAPKYEAIFHEENGVASFELGNFTWALHNIWRHYRSIMDKSFLKNRFYPLLKGNINTFFRLASKEEDGKWHLPKLTSPEYPGPDGSTSYPIEDTNYDLALFRWGCQTLLEICDTLEIQDSMEDKWKDICDHLTEAPVDENGLMVGRGLSFTQSHRHYSHLVSLYPLHLLDIEKQEERALAEKSFQHWINLEGGHAGYSYTGGCCMAATLGEGNQALEILNKLKGRLLPNTLYIEGGGPVIETPLSGVESIHYMLLQCWGDTIRTFPAVPDQWQNITFVKLLAEGAFEITGSRKDGENIFIYITSLKGAPLKIKPNLAGAIKTLGSRFFHIQEIEDGIYEIDLKEGESVLLYSGEVVPEIMIAPVH